MESEKIDDVKVGFTPAHGSSEKTGIGDSFIWVYLVLRC